jgi:NDP-sugar pyrophosphorylase family protein
MTDLIQRLVDSNHTVVIFPIIEYWMDIGQLADYKQAQNDVENRRLEKNSMRNNHCAAM